MANLERDENRVTVLGAISDVDGSIQPLKVNSDGEVLVAFSGSGAGDVSGPASSTDNAIARFDGTGGKTLQDSGILISDTDSISGIVNITLTGTVDGRDVATDGTKLDTVETNADVTDEANVVSALDGATLTGATVAGTDKVLIQDTDGSDALKTVTAQAIADLASAGTPTDITVANEATDTSCFVAFFTAATGDLGPKTNAGLTFNSNTAVLTATGFAGPLVGNVTGDVSGSAATVTGATQAAITTLANLVSVGTITSGTWSADLAADTVDAITEIAAALKSGADATLITGTAGTDGDLAQWNADGDLVDGPTPPTGAIVGTTDTQTLTNKTIESKDNTIEIRRIVQVTVFDGATAVATGDGKAYFNIPPELNGYNIVDADACVTTASSSGTPTIQIHNVTSAADILTTLITIDANEKTSYTAATAPVISGTEDDVATGDELRIDVDVAGTSTAGLRVILVFAKP